jgi:hypothetical protein
MLPTTGDSKLVSLLDTVTAIQQVQDDKLGPGQSMAKNIVEWNNKIVGMGVEIEYQWVLFHKVVEGNETADEQAKAALERAEGTLELVNGYKGWSMAELQRWVTQAKLSETEYWWKAKFNIKKGGYRMHNKRRMSKLLGETKNSVVGRLLQLKV